MNKLLSIKKAILLILAICATGVQSAVSQTKTVSASKSGKSLISSEWQFEKAREFDFWIGEWDVSLFTYQSDNSWKEWKKSKANIYNILDGKAILELWEEKSENAPTETIIGYSLRYYDSELEKWVLWLNWPGVNQSGSSSLTGNFRNGKGEFFSSRPLNDSTTLTSRYTFSDITPTSLRWSDSFSRDDGKTWAKNWMMKFTRTADRSKKFSGNKIHTYRNGKRCTAKEFNALKRLIGNWKGKMMMVENNWNGKEVILNNYWALGGCSVMSFLETISDDDTMSFKQFALHTFNTYAKLYEVGILDNKLSSTYRSYYGLNEDNNEFVLNRMNQANGEIEETYSWSFAESKQLRIQKWIYKNGKKVKTLDSQLNRYE